jgi:hypothetical protein
MGLLDEEIYHLLVYFELTNSDYEHRGQKVQFPSLIYVRESAMAD